MDRKTFIKSIAVIGASPAFAVGVPSKDAAGKNKTKSESFGGGFVPSARIFKTGRAKLTIRPPEKYAGKLSSLSVSILYGDAAWDGKSDSFPWARDFPAKYREENGAFAIDADFKKECRYTFVVKDKKRGGNESFVASVPVYALGEDIYALRPFKGDSHIHSTNSDGKNSPEEVALRCYEVGLDYQAISDHSVYSTSEDMKRKFSRFPTSMSFFNAEECHYSHAHIQNFGGSQSLTEYVKKNRREFDALVAEIEKTLPADVSAVVRRNVAVAEAEFDFIRRLGGIAVFNHPFWEAAPKKGKYTHMESRMLDLIAGRQKFDAYELVNSTCADIALARALCHYPRHCAGKPVIGCTDAHSVDLQGTGYTIVFAKSCDFPDIKGAVLGGKSLAVDAYSSHGSKLQRLAFGDERLVRFSYFLFDEYFPLHDELVAREGKLIKGALESGSKDYSEIAEAAKAVEGLYESMLG